MTAYSTADETNANDLPAMMAELDQTRDPHALILDTVDRNTQAIRGRRPDAFEATAQALRRARGHPRDAYRADPEAVDNRRILRNAPTPEIRQRIIDGRIRHLESEIATFRKQIDDIRRGGQ